MIISRVMHTIIIPGSFRSALEQTKKNITIKDDVYDIYTCVCVEQNTIYHSSPTVCNFDSRALALFR